MYLCICNSVTDRDIRGAVGVGATTVKSLCRELGIAISCPSCTMCVRQHLSDALEREDMRGRAALAASA